MTLHQFSPYEPFRDAILALCLVVLLSGCAQLSIAGPDAARLSSAFVARLDAAPLFAAAPGGKQVAFARDGVRIAPLPTGKSRALSTDTPLALAWSPDGWKLAAAFGRGTESRIAVFDDGGITVAETTVPGRVGALFWPAPGALLAVSLELEHHKFGTSCREVLLRWDLVGVPERTILHEVTLMPSTVRKWDAASMARAISPALSPLGDELVYGRLQDPPAFAAFMKKIMVHNISTGAEREIVKTGFADGTARFTVDGEELFVSDASGQIRLLGVWSGAEKQIVPFSGRALAVSPDGLHLLADGRLLDAGREVALFPTGTTGEFLDDGRLLAAADGTLFLVSGFGAPVAGPALPPEKRKRLSTLRAWRSSGLISADDYVTAREKVMK